MSAGPEQTCRVLSCLTRAGSEAALLSEIASIVQDESGAQECEVLVRLPGDSLVLRGSTFRPEWAGLARVGPGVGLVGKVIRKGEPIVVPDDLADHPDFAHYPGLDTRLFRSAVVVPVPVEGDVGAAMVLRRHEPWRPAKAEMAAITSMAEATGQAIEAFRRIYEAGSHSDRLDALKSVTAGLAASPYLEEILQLLVSITAQQFKYVVCTIRLLDEVSQELVLRATQSTLRAYRRKRAIKLGESIAGRAIVERQTMIVPDVQSSEEYIGPEMAAEQGLKSMICVPLTVEHKGIGVLTCYTDEVRDFPPDEVEALEMLAQQAAIRIEHAKLQARHTLMHEMNHRVKNNLQQVASLLSLQLQKGRYATVEQALKDSLSRILTIASVHQLLSRDDLDHVNVVSIAESLSQLMQQSVIPPDKNITIQTTGDKVRLNMMQATQVALILHELLHNAVEHGYRDAQEGEIHINIEDRDDQVGLWVSNRGDSLPEGFDPVASGHLGLELVLSLTRALGGKFTLQDRLNWTVAEVKFQRYGAE